MSILQQIPSTLPKNHNEETDVAITPLEFRRFFVGAVMVHKKILMHPA